jgi:hypothetical protein
VAVTNGVNKTSLNHVGRSFTFANHGAIWFGQHEQAGLSDGGASEHDGPMTQ